MVLVLKWLQIHLVLFLEFNISQTFPLQLSHKDGLKVMWVGISIIKEVMGECHQR